MTHAVADVHDVPAMSAQLDRLNDLRRKLTDVGIAAAELGLSTYGLEVFTHAMRQREDVLSSQILAAETQADGTPDRSPTR